MSTRAVESVNPTKRTRDTSWLYMFFSTIWVGVLIGGSIDYWRIPDDSMYDTPVATGFKLLGSVLVAAFICIYAYTVWRMYFNRTSWLVVFSRTECWVIRGALTGIAILLHLLPNSHPQAGWQVAFMFVAIAWALTSTHEHAIASVFQAAGIGAITLIATGREEILTGTMIYVVGFGVMVAGYVMNNGLIGHLMVERGRVRDQAVTEERFRLARDLHDTVGHSMTQITLKAELARRVLPDDPSRAADELEQIEQLSRSLSTEVRRSIAGEVSPSLKSETERASELLQSMQIEPTIQGDFDHFPEETADVLAWCLREGVMNVIKHSGATKCDISFSRSDKHHLLKIADNGTNPDSDDHEGQGIAGMNDRVDELNGDVYLRTTDSGHELTVRIPA